MTTPRDDTLMSIGAVSKATGIPAETLRTWERRYDFPKPARSQSGHRRYSTQVIEPLKLIHTALVQGHRPSQIVGQDLDTLRALLNITTSSPSHTSPPPPQPSPQDATLIIAHWMQLVTTLDPTQLRAELERAWFQRGPLNTLTTLIAPFLNELGDAWHEGRIAVFHEQLASQQLRDFLSSQWTSISDRASGPSVLMATLPGEYHLIGLHMAACIMAITGHQLHLLGADKTPDDIAFVATQTHASAVLVSISTAANTAMTTPQLQRLRALLPEQIDLITGGAGAPTLDDLALTTRIKSLHDLYQWALDRPHAQ